MAQFNSLLFQTHLCQSFVNRILNVRLRLPSTRTLTILNQTSEAYLLGIGLLGRCSFRCKTSPRYFSDGLSKLGASKLSNALSCDSLSALTIDRGSPCHHCLTFKYSFSQTLQSRCYSIAAANRGTPQETCTKTVVPSTLPFLSVLKLNSFGPSPSRSRKFHSDIKKQSSQNVSMSVKEKKTKAKKGYKHWPREGKGEESFSPVDADLQGTRTSSPGVENALASALDTEEGVISMTTEVWQRGGEVDVMVRSVPQSRLKDLILDLHACGLDPNDILLILTTHPTYILKPGNLLPSLHTLLSSGFQPAQTRDILLALPSFAQIPPAKISKAMNDLRHFSFYEKSIIKVLAGNPAILGMDTSALRQRLGGLQQLFKTADVVTLVVNAPSVVTEPWDDLQALFEYVFYEMKITQRQMVYASLFSYSLLHVKQRYEFLVRAGLFDTSKKKEGEINVNPRLDRIITTSDEAFAKRFGKYSVAEYSAFCSLFNKETALKESEESEE